MEDRPGSVTSGMLNAAVDSAEAELSKVGAWCCQRQK